MIVLAKWYILNTAKNCVWDKALMSVLMVRNVNMKDAEAAVNKASDTLLQNKYFKILKNCRYLRSVTGTLNLLAGYLAQDLQTQKKFMLRPKATVTVTEFITMILILRCQ